MESADAASSGGALCHDCGMGTTPCTGKRGCRHKGKWEWYMVHDAVWRDAAPDDRTPVIQRSDSGRHFYLCVGCLERRLGRVLEPGDFIDAPINARDDPWHTPRLTARLG